MYLAVKKTGKKSVFCLRESRKVDGRLVHHEQIELGDDPSAYIVYPGGNAFYFDQDLVAALAGQNVKNIDNQLEILLFPFLDPHIQRIVRQTTRLQRKRRFGLSQEAMAREQARLHSFDRRRAYFLRFGRMDSTPTVMRPHRFYTRLLDKSRDELEHDFRREERRLRVREIKRYVFAAFDLGSHFPGDFAKLFPSGLDVEKVDAAFMSEICRLNADPEFLDPLPDSGRLSEYLLPYAYFWFDFDFVEPSPAERLFESFTRRHRAYKPPPPTVSFDFEEACGVFGMSSDEYREMSREDLQKTYWRLAFERHPDQGGNQEDFVRLGQAYDKLLSAK